VHAQQAAVTAEGVEGLEIHEVSQMESHVHRQCRMALGQDEAIAVWSGGTDSLEDAPIEDRYDVGHRQLRPDVADARPPGLLEDQTTDLP
jgi:hypothetical protein